MHPIELSTKVIDSGIVDQPLNRVTNDITELADNLAIVESFSHSVVWDTGDGLMCFDASGAGSGIAVVVVREYASGRRIPLTEAPVRWSLSPRINTSILPTRLRRRLLLLVVDVG